MRAKQFLFIALSAVDSYVVFCNGFWNDKDFMGQNQSQTIGGNRKVYILLSSDDPEWIPCGSTQQLIKIETLLRYVFSAFQYLSTGSTAFALKQAF